MLRIRVHAGDSHTFVFDRDVVTIGRGEDRDLVIDEAPISRHHLTIRVDPARGVVTVTDHASTNGTRIRGIPLEGTREIGADDPVWIGGATLYATIVSGVPEDVTHDDEHALLEALRRDPADDAMRAVYADWLEENGRRARAEFLRMQVQARGAAPETDAFTEASARLHELAREVGDAWRARVAMAVVQGCGGEKVAFELSCSMRWDQMQPTDKERVRRCGACKKEVLYCATPEEAWTRAEEGGCVAIDVPIGRRPEPMVRGIAAPRPRVPRVRRGRG